MIAEASNPFLVTRTTLRIIGQKNTALYANNELIFAGVFIFMRVLVCPFLMIGVYESPSGIYALKLSGCIV